MTDKQIIIDGVDVSRCRYYDDRYGYCDACRDDIDGASFTKCLYEDNCYYKQLKAKEQECEELKEQLKEMNEVIRTETTRCSLVNILKIELDQLKAELTRANCQIADDEILQCDMREAIEELKAENEELKKQRQADKGLITSTGKMNYQLLQEYAKYKAESDLLRQAHKTEQDRRRAYENALTEIKEIAEKRNYLDYNECLDDILQKISEVEDET